MAGSGTTQLRDERYDIVLRVENLVVEFPASGGRKVHAVSDVSFDVAHGETLGLVGESGCGKSTTGKAIMQLPPPTAGSVRFDGRELTQLKGDELRKVRPELAMIFQDPISSLNPRRRVRDIIAEPLVIAGEKGYRPKVNEVMETVGLDPSVSERRPHEFSGGQCQRISIARALVQEPKVVLCDEPVSALDVSVQAQILNLLEDMKEQYGLTLLFVSHDLAVVKNISDRVAVMYLGKLCELATPDDLYSNPLHPYTNALMASIPQPNPGLEAHTVPLVGELPSPLDPPSGCRFRTRCPKAQQRCADEEPAMHELRPGHFVACHFPLSEEEQVDARSEASLDATPNGEVPVTPATAGIVAGSDR